MSSEKKTLKVFPITSLWELYMGMVAILIYEPYPFVHIFNPPLTRLHMKLKEILGLTGEVVQMCVRTDGRKDDGRGVIIIAHPEPSDQVS